MPQELTWLASAAGGGRQVLEVDPQAGSWVVVVMAPDPSPGLSVEVDVGAELPWLAPVAGVLLALALALMLTGALGVGLGVRAATLTPPGEATGGPAGSPPVEDSA
jgi:hypothetical protein